jgi:hypothetical protein
MEKKRTANKKNWLHRNPGMVEGMELQTKTR